MGQDPSPERAEDAPALGHRSVRRELFQIAAAALVLAAVAGILVLIFRSHGPSRPAAFSSLATPTASSSLPMTATARGISVTLQLVNFTSSATRFHVNIALPKYAIDQPTDFILGQAPANDVQLAGMNTSASELKPMEVDTTNSADTLWLNYPAPFPPNRTVTLTIDRLWLPEKPASPVATPTDWNTYTPTPVHMHTVAGPWTFQITPQMVATQALPTPQNDFACGDSTVSMPPKMYCYLPMGLPLARKLVSFPIIEPNPLPVSLSPDPFSVRVLGQGTSGANRANYVSLYYPTRRYPGQQDVQLVETTDHAAMPIINGTTGSIATPLSLGGATETVAIRPGTLATMTIDGVTVTRCSSDESGSTYYVWTQAGIGSYIRYDDFVGSVKQISQVTDAELRQMVTSLIEQRAGQATPGTTPPASPQAQPPA